MRLTLARAIDALCLAEKQIALLDRVRPCNHAREVDRLVSGWMSGDEPSARLQYLPAPSLTNLRRGLALVVECADDWGTSGLWLRARAEELDCEAALVEAVGTEAFSSLARRRFPSPEPALAAAVARLIEPWLQTQIRYAEEDVHLTEASSDKSSLFAILQSRLRELSLDAVVRVDCNLPSLAATGDGTISIRSGEHLTRKQAQRIAEHEIVAHLAPRIQARKAKGLLRCGCRFATADEEGRALLIESRLSLMDTARRRELSLRHSACVLSRDGADFVEVVRALRELQAPLRVAVVTALRCFRGATLGKEGAMGKQRTSFGLGRELVYLPAFLRVKAAFDAAPGLERWFERGRATVEYARLLETDPTQATVEFPET